MPFSISVLLDEGDVAQLTAWAGALGRRAAREEIIPILKAHLEPMVEHEKATLSSHTKSGALAASLSSRSGSGDRPGTMSVFAAPTATTKQLRQTWGKRGSAQQRAWAGETKGKGRRMVFYADFVEKGHRFVKRNAQGQQYDTGARAAPVKFAEQAVAALGEQQADAAAGAIMDHILGE